MNLTSAFDFVSRKTLFRPLKLLRVFFLLLLPMISSCGGNDDYEIYSSISGYVSDYDTAAPISDATVTLSPGGLTTRTDAAGNFSFSNLDSQQFTLIVQKTGYQPNRKTITAISGEETTVVVTLARIPQ